MKINELKKLEKMVSDLVKEYDISNTETKNRVNLNKPELVFEEFKWMGSSDVEEAIVVILDSQCKMMDWKVISKGDVAQTILSPRMVLHPVLIAGAATFMTVHNHPGGSTSPSAQDIKLFNDLDLAANIMGVVHLDSLIIGLGAEYFSWKRFRER